MRLKECLTQGVAHANRPSSIDDNSLDRIENNQAPDTASKLSSTFVDRTQWENNYKLTENLDNDENFNLSLKQTDFSFLSPAADGQDSDPGASSGSSDSSSASSPEEGYRSLSSDTDSEGLNTHRPVVRGIVNPNYPGFQHFADQLVSPCHCDDHNNNNNNSDDPDELTINRLDRHDVKSFYDKPKFDLGDTLDTLSELVTCLNIPLKNKMATEVDNKMADALAEEEVKSPEVEVKMPEVAVKRLEFEVKRPEVDVKRPEFEVNRPEMEVKSPELEVKRPEVEMKSPEVGMKRLEMAVKRPEVELKRPEVVRKRDKMALNLKTGPTRRTRDRRRTPPDPTGSFDVYNIETALPTIDMDAIENHLRAAREQERRRRNDREEIRKRLATGCDAEEYLGGDRPGRKPSLQSRLQSGMNLQICFMNDTMSDTESPSSDSEHGPKGGTPTKQASPLAAHPAAIARSRAAKPPPDPPNNNIKGAAPSAELSSEADLVAVQAEARAALAQAADLARLQMEGERQRRQTSPITQIIRNALHKVGVELDADRRRVSRQMLTDMNLAQLQVIVNDLHTQIEYLNEGLVEFLMERDDLHMGQDSMLVDIEDLTRYIGAKEDVLNEDLNINNNVPAMKPKPHRMAAMRK